MENFDYTISIGQLGEQLTLNQWVLGSSPRWCTKNTATSVAVFFYAPSPSGRAHASRKRLHSPRGDRSLKNVPLERFLNAPADGAPETALHSV